MFLEVDNPDSLTDLGDFCDYLVEEMTEFATDKLNQDSKQVDRWNSYYCAYFSIYCISVVFSLGLVRIKRKLLYSS